MMGALLGQAEINRDRQSRERKGRQMDMAEKEKTKPNRKNYRKNDATNAERIENQANVSLKLNIKVSVTHL